MTIQDMLAELRRAQEELDILAGDMAKVMAQLEAATERAELLERTLRETLPYLPTPNRDLIDRVKALTAEKQPETTPRDP